MPELQSLFEDGFEKSKLFELEDGDLMSEKSSNSVLSLSGAIPIPVSSIVVTSSTFEGP